MQAPAAPLLVDRNYFPQEPLVANDHIGAQVGLPTDRIDRFVLVDDASSVEVLPTAVLGTLGVADSDAPERFREVVVLVPLLGVFEDLDSRVKNRRKGLPATEAGVSRP